MLRASVEKYWEYAFKSLFMLVCILPGFQLPKCARSSIRESYSSFQSTQTLKKNIKRTLEILHFHGSWLKKASLMEHFVTLIFFLYCKLFIESSSLTAHKQISIFP